MNIKAKLVEVATLCPNSRKEKNIRKQCHKVIVDTVCLIFLVVLEIGKILLHIAVCNQGHKTKHIHIRTLRNVNRGKATYF